MRTAIATFSSLVVLGIALPAAATTWYVELDGSGDFTVIQDAVDAASDGDVIEIGPGRFDDYEIVWDGNWPIYDVYVDLQGKALSLHGAGAGITIIGPDDPEHHPWPGRHVFVMIAIQCPSLDIRGMTIEHSPWKLLNARNVGTLNVTECVFRGGGFGIFGIITLSGNISRCHFENLSEPGVSIHNPTPSCRVENCTFNDVYVPVKINWTSSYCDVSNCEMDGGRVGVSIAGGGSGSVTNCVIRNFENYGIGILDDGNITITDNVIEQATGSGMALGDAYNTVVRQNVINTETGKCLYLPWPCDGMVFESNDLSRGEGNFVETNDYWPYTPPTYFHLENNYWGTTDAEEIAAHILDGNDMDDVNMFVIFEPFEGEPVPVERKSWSELKALFR